MDGSFKKYLVIFLVFIILFALIFICIHFLSKGYTNRYSIDNYSIKEIYTKDEQNEHDNYYIEIEANGIKYNYQFYSSIKDDNKLVKGIEYYDGEYKCLLPILSDDIKVDFLCYKDKEYYNYQDIKGKDESLDKYIEQIDTNKYSDKIFKNNSKGGVEVNNITYYKDIIPSKFVISMSTLKGIISINDEVIKKELFDKDIYKRDISIFYENYYVTANYNDNQEFKEFYIVNILNNKEKIIKTPDYISFDSYIQGVVDNCIYIYDINNEKQYKLDIESSTVTQIGNTNNNIKYYNGSWKHITTIKANNTIKFKNNNENNDYYEYIYKDGNKLSGFYYYFLKVDDGYKVFRANVQNKSIKKYLFWVKDYNDVVFEEDYVFYKDDDSIKMYSDYTGIKTIIKNKELSFNNNIIFNVYKK